MLSLATFFLKQHRWWSVIDHMACKPERFTIWPLSEKVRWCLQEDGKKEREPSLPPPNNSLWLSVASYCCSLVRVRTHNQTKAVNTELYISYWENDAQKRLLENFSLCISEARVVLFRLKKGKTCIIYIPLRSTIKLKFIFFKTYLRLSQIIAIVLSAKINNNKWIKSRMSHHDVNTSLLPLSVPLIQRMQSILHLFSVFIQFYCPHNSSVRVFKYFFYISLKCNPHTKKKNL